MDKPVCLITGVGPGTGAECARRFARDGYRVAMLARNRERLDELAAEIDGAKGYVCDVSDLDQLVSTVHAVQSEMGAPEVVIHGSGKINSAVLKLSGAFGNFITDKGTPVVIDQYDRFRIQAEDLNGNKYDRYFEFIPLIIPSQTKTEGTQLELDLVGLEYHTQRINYAGRHWFANGFDVAAAIGRSYNDNKKVRQPILNGHEVSYSQTTKIGNGFPMAAAF